MYLFSAGLIVGVLRPLPEIENIYVATNAMGLLADLAQTYPYELVGFLPRCREELESIDDYMRYNALTVVTRIAKEHPELVEEEIRYREDTEMLDEELDGTHEKACWALKNVGIFATDALPELHRLKKEDQDERVREISGYAALHIEKETKDWSILTLYVLSTNSTISSEMTSPLSSCRKCPAPSIHLSG